MATSKQDINDFNARLRRIKNPRNKSYYDRDLGMHVPKKVSRARIQQNAETDSFVAILLVSLVLGAIAMVFAQVVRIRYFGLIAPSDTVLVIEVFVALWAVVLLAALLKKRTTMERVAQYLGIAAMLVAGHNLIWRWPEPMATIYTSAYVDQVLEATDQNTIVFRGSVFGL